MLANSWKSARYYDQRNIQAFKSLLDLVLHFVVFQMSLTCNGLEMY